MTKQSGGATIDEGGASKRTQGEQDAGFEIAGNAEVRGEVPSPLARERDETGSAREECPVDLEAAHDRAS